MSILFFKESEMLDVSTGKLLSSSIDFCTIICINGPADEAILIYNPGDIKYKNTLRFIFFSELI